MISSVIKVIAIVIITASLTISISVQKPEYAFILSLACGAVAMLFLFDLLVEPIARLKSAFQKFGGVSPYFSVAIKALGISYLAGFAADTCRDFGQTALALKAEFAGRCAIFILCIPLAISIIEAALKFSGL